MQTIERMIYELGSSEPEFAAVAAKWREKVQTLVRKRALALSISVEDATQEVFIDMWQAFQAYHKPQVRYFGSIYEVVEDGVYYVLQKEGVAPFQAHRFQCEPVRKCSLPSFVYMRLLQEHSNALSRHFSVQNGYKPGGTVDVRGKPHRTFVPAVYQESLEAHTMAEGGDDDVTPNIERYLATSRPSPETDVSFSESVSTLFNRLSSRKNASALLALLLETYDGVFDCTDEEGLQELASVLGLCEEDTKKALRSLIQELPAATLTYEAVCSFQNGRKLKLRPVQLALESP